MSLHPDDQAKFLKEVVGLDFFQAQVALENEEINRYLKRLVSLPLTDGQLSLDYAELRGRILAIQELQNIRKRITDAAPSALKRERA